MKCLLKIALVIAALALIATAVASLFSKQEKTLVASQAIPSSFTVGAAGNVNWSMDIEVPPGIQGIEPQLSINYTSQTTSGLLGIGFDLQGLSEITRTGASVAQDGFNGGISYTGTDRFQLDGNRLMAMKGSYGAAGSVYHTERESWTKVVAAGQSGSGPQYFQVWTKQGVYFEYGNTTDARVVTLSATATPSFPAGTVREWLVNKCRDLHGNTLTVTYTQTPSDSSGNTLSVCQGQGQSYPVRIDYTSNDSVKALRSVQFFYEARPDSITCFTGGAKFCTRARISAIRTYVKDEKGDSTLVREVRLNYKTQTPLSVSCLASVQVKAGNCAFAPTSFSWSQGQDTLLAKPIGWPGNGTNTGFTGDFNGDGKNDILQSNAHVYFGADSGFVDAGNTGLLYNTSMNNFVGDFNGDGISDFMAGSTSGGTIYYFNQQTHEFSSSQTVTGLTISNGCYPNKCVWQGDFNGDGLSDLCSALGTTVFTNFGNSTTGLNPGKQQTNLYVYQGNTFAADFNGDGLTDLFSCNPGMGYLTISNWSDSTGFRKTVEIPGMNFTISSTQSYTWVGDYNGDGLADLLARGTDGNYRVYYSTGTGFQSGKTISINLSTTAVWPADFNHDGKMDFYAATNTNGIIYLSNGLDFSVEEPVSYAFQPQYTWLGDFNGDGLTDLFNAYYKKVYYGGNAKAAQQNINQQANLITSINNGIGSVISATYKPITDSSVYVPGTSLSVNAMEGQRVLNAYNSFPLSSVQNQLNGVISIQQAMYVVANWSETDGRGATYAYRCNYAGAKYDLTGYGFLGFEKTQTENLSEGSVEQTFYLQNFPFTGMQDSSVLLDVKGNLYEAGLNVWDSLAEKTAGTEPVYEVLQKTANTFSFYQNEVACKSQLQYWYDAFGNVKQTANTGDVAHPATLWTLSVYENDTASWQLGYLSASSQSSDSSGSQKLSAVKIGYNAQRSIDSLYTWFSPDNTWLTRTFGYDTFGNQLFQTSYKGDTTRVAYDSIYHSFPVVDYSPPNAQGLIMQTHSTYEPFYGNCVASTDASGNRFNFIYDALGRLKEAWIPDSSGVQTLAMQMNYLPSDSGFTLQQIGLRNWSGTLKDTSCQYYDGLSRNFKTENVGWQNQHVFSQKKFNASSQVTAASSVYFSAQQPVWSRAEYDPAGRAIRSVVPFATNDSIVSRILYQGLTMRITRAAGTPDSTVSTYTYTYYNSKTCVTNFLNASGNTTTYTWDLLGRINRATDGQGNQTAASWNSLDLNDWYYSASFDTTFFYYQPSQQSTRTVDALHDTVQYTFDNLGRILSGRASRTAPVTYLYDVAGVKNGYGNLCSVTQDNGATNYSFAYDALSNAITEQVQLDGHSWKQSAVYNPDCSLAALVFPNGTQAEWQYNAAGQALALNRKNKGTSLAVTGVNSMDASGNWLQYTYGNGVSTQKSFYADATLKSMLVSAPNQTADWSKTYTWNKHGLISGISDLLDAAAGETYSYNPTGRLLGVNTAAGKDSMAYDLAGNLTWNDSTLFTYAAYQVKSGMYGSQEIYSAQYNAAGEMYSRSCSELGTTKNYRYSYNGYGQLDSVYRNDTLVSIYTYDYSGKRNRAKDVLKNAINYQVFDTYSELFGTGVSHTSCNFSMGGMVFATFFDTGDSAEYYSCNQNSSTILVTAANGNVLERLSYAPYGKFKRQSATSAQAQYKFNGKEFDSGSGLYYFNARYYDPFSCRFTSADDQLGGDLVTPDALNNYAFAGNSPITLSDPSGHVPTGSKAAKEVAELIVLGTAEGVIAVGSEGTAVPVEKAVNKVLLVDVTKKTVDLSMTDVLSTVSKKAEEEVTAPGATTTIPKKSTGKRSRDVAEMPRRQSTRKVQKLHNIEGCDLNEHGENVVREDPADLNFDIDKHRPGYGAGQKAQVWNDAKDKAGHVFCPGKGCGKELTGQKTYSRGSKMVIDWQMGHRPGYEFKHLWALKDAGKITESEFLTEYRDPKHYQPECPPCNLSHKYELPTSRYMTSILKRRGKFSYYRPAERERYSIPFYRRPEEEWHLQEEFKFRQAA